MTQSREYVLERLDRWYADRFRRNYTDEIAEVAIDNVTTSLKKKSEEFLGDEESVMHGSDFLSVDTIPQKFSREEQIKEAQEYFTKAYSSIEGIIEGLQIDERPFGEISRGEMEECVAP